MPNVKFAMIVCAHHLAVLLQAHLGGCDDGDGGDVVACARRRTASFGTCCDCVRSQAGHIAA